MSVVIMNVILHSYKSLYLRGVLKKVFVRSHKGPPAYQPPHKKGCNLPDNSWLAESHTNGTIPPHKQRTVIYTAPLSWPVREYRKPDLQQTLSGKYNRIPKNNIPGR